MNLSKVVNRQHLIVSICKMCWFLYDKTGEFTMITVQVFTSSELATYAVKNPHFLNMLAYLKHLLQGYKEIAQNNELE